MRQGKPARQYSQAGRLHSLIRILESRQGVTVHDLAEELDVDRRTIHRGLNAVEQAGYTLTSEWQEGRKVYSFLTRSRNIPPIVFSLNQLMSLYLLRSMTAFFAGTPFQAEIDELFMLIRSVLPDRYVAHLEKIARVSLPLLQGARDYSAAGAHIEALQKALMQQFRVRLSYAKTARSSGEGYELDPYTLVFHKGGIYLLGYAHNRGGMRLFALERIRGVEVSKQRFEIIDGYEPDGYFRSSFGLVNDRLMQVKVRFSAEVAHAVKDRIWRPGQRVKVDRSRRLTLEFEAAGEREIAAWILSYGQHAEVLEPPELRAEIARQVAEMNRIYHP